MIDAASKRIVEHIVSLPEQPAANVEGAVDLARQLVEPLPERGSSLVELLDLLFDEYVPRSFNTAGPGYLAYIPGGGLFHAALADFIATAVNRYVGVAAAAPVLVQLESNVIRWFCEIAGLPRGSGGVLTTGGSMANFIATVAARKDRLPADFLRGTMYVSDQVHHSVVKAANVAGFPAVNVRKIESDDCFRIQTDAFRAAIRRDREDGWLPFMVVGSAGTTNTGAVDDLEELAASAASEGLWFHVDAAYGGFFMLTERGRDRMKGLEKADSLSLDPHKGLFLPYGTGCLLVRDPATLRRAHSSHGDYMPPMQDEGGLVDFCEISPELSRDFRGLRVWLPLRLLGIEPFREALDEKLDLTTFTTAELRTMPDVEIVAEPQLSVVAFRYAPEGDSRDLDELNRRLLAAVNARKRVHLTGTLLAGRFVIRICVLSFRTHRERVEMGLEDIRQSIAGLAR